MKTIRKVDTINSIAELNLSSQTQKLVERRFGTDVEGVIKAGRNIALVDALHPEHESSIPEYKKELVRVLNEAGFIRHDLNPRTWCVWGLYIAILTTFSLVNGATHSLATLVDRKSFASSKEYESMPAVNDEDFEKVISALDSLSEKERNVLILRFGLEDGILRDFETIAKKFCVTRERIRQLEARALRKMRDTSRLCKLPALFGFVPPAEPELEEHFVANGTRVLDINADISDLNLSVRAYNCLKRYACINTVEDILNYPKEDWPKIKNLGRKATLEIQEKMRSVGYPDFSVPLS